MKLKGMLLVLVGAAGFGLTPIFVKSGFKYGYSLGQLNVAQMLIAVAVLWLSVLVFRLPVGRISGREIIKIMFMGTTVGLTSVFYYAAMRYLPASIAIILLFQFVWIGYIYDWVFNKTKPRAIDFIVLIMTLAGVFFASDVVSGGLDGLPGIGLVLGIFSAVSYAGFIFLSGRIGLSVHPTVRTAYMALGSAVVITLVFIRDVPAAVTADGGLWFFAAGVSLFGTIVPPLFFAYGAYRIPGALANVLGSIELPVAIISASLVLGEEVKALQWVGIVMILLAIVAGEFGPRLFKRGGADMGKVK